MKMEKLSSVDKLLLKGCDAINAINVVGRTLGERVGLKTTLTLDKKRLIEINKNILKAKNAMQEVMRVISEASKANRREDV